jgi:hypothetical protein
MCRFPISFVKYSIILSKMFLLPWKMREGGGQDVVIGGSEGLVTGTLGAKKQLILL